MGRYEVLHRKAKAGVLTKICCSAATGARASVCVHHPPQALPHVKLLWTFSCEQPNVGHPFVRIKHSFRLLRNWLNEYKTQSMAKHDLCQDPNLFSLTTSRIEICTWFLRCIACSLSTQSYSQVLCIYFAKDKWVNHESKMFSGGHLACKVQPEKENCRFSAPETAHVKNSEVQHCHSAAGKFLGPCSLLSDLLNPGMSQTHPASPICDHYKIEAIGRIHCTSNKWLEKRTDDIQHLGHKTSHLGFAQL